MVRTSENGDFIGKNSDFGGKYYTIHGNSQEVWYQRVPCKYTYSTYTVHCKYKYKNKHSILKIQIQLQYSGKWQEVWSSSYHALANSTRHSVSSKTKHIQRRLFLLQCLHKNTSRTLKVKVFHFDQSASVDFRPKIHNFYPSWSNDIWQIVSGTLPSPYPHLLRVLLWVLGTFQNFAAERVQSTE